MLAGEVGMGGSSGGLSSCEVGWLVGWLALKCWVMPEEDGPICGEAGTFQGFC